MRRLAVVPIIAILAATFTSTIAAAQARPTPRPAQGQPARPTRSARPSAKPAPPSLRPGTEPRDGSARPTERRRAPQSERIDTATVHEKCPGWPNCEEEGDTSPPEIWLSSGSLAITATPTIQVSYCDNHSLDYSTRDLRLNSSTVTSYFGWNYTNECSTFDVTTSLTLSLGSNTLRASMCDLTGNCTTEYFDITYDPKVPAAISLAPYAPDVLDVGRCALGCFAASHAQSTIPFYTLDTPRSVTLVYNSDRAEPKPFIHIDVAPQTTPETAPSLYRLKVRKASGTPITFVNGDTVLYFQAGTASTLRLGAQFDAAANGMGTTDVYPVTVVVGAQYASGLVESSVGTRVMVVNESGSNVAKGWTIAGIQRAYQVSGGIIVTDGTGSAAYFQASGGSFITPAGEFSKLTGSYGALTRWYPDSTRVYIGTGSRMTSITDRFGSQSYFLYDFSLRVIKIQDPTNAQFNTRETILAYDANGLDSIIDAMGRVTGIGVNASGLLDSIRDPDNVSTTFTYSGVRLTSVRDRRGNRSTLGYHAGSGKLDSISADSIDLFDNSRVVPRTLLTPWQIVSVPYGATSSGSPFASLRPDSARAVVTDPGGHSSRFTANAFGQPLRMTGPLGDTTTTAYNSLGQPTSMVDRLGFSSSYTYDANGFLTRSIIAGDTTNFRSGGWAQADSAWGNGVARRLFLNSTNGRVDSARTGGQAISRFTYDSRGRLLTARDHLGDLTASHAYYGSGSNESNLWKDSVPSGAATSFGYDGYGRLHTVTLTGLPARTTNYDIVNRPITQYDGVNANPTTFAYDGLQLTSVTDARGQVYGFSYNAMGSLVRRTYPDTWSDTIGYDADGLVRRTVNRWLKISTLTYDSLHRRLVRSGTHITPDTLSYSGDGRTVVSANAAARDSVWLNARLQPATIRTALRKPDGSVEQAFTLTNTYSPSGLRTATSVSGGGVSFQTRQFAWRGGIGSLDSLRFGSSPWTRIGYTADLLAQATRFSSTDSIYRTFVEGHGLMSILSPWMFEQYGRDALNRISRAGAWSSGFRNFAYDSLGQLRSTGFNSSVWGCSYTTQNGWNCSFGGVDSTHSFAYDAVGNRTDHSGGYSTTGNRITSFDSCTYGTDTLGNVKTRACDGSPTFTWDADSRLTSFTTGSTTVGFAYDAAGRLVRKDVNGSVQSYFLWDGDHLVAELGSTATTRIAEYMYYPGGLDNLYAIGVGSTNYVAVSDAMGNVRRLTNGTGTLARSYNYDEWGRLASGTDNASLNDADRARFKGALWMGPELDVYYMRNRWYEPRTGRFLSQDPIGLRGGINNYAFAGGDPINASDPRGLDVQCEDVVIGYRRTVYSYEGSDEILWATPWSPIYKTVCTGSNGGPGGGGGTGTPAQTPADNTNQRPNRPTQTPAPSCDSDRLVAFGLQASYAASVLGGQVMAAGNYATRGGAQGGYVTEGRAFGFGGGFGVEGTVGTSGSFFGRSVGLCVNGPPGFLGGCVTLNSNGLNVTYTGGPGAGAYLVDTDTRRVPPRNGRAIVCTEQNRAPAAPPL